MNQQSMTRQKAVPCTVIDAVRERLTEASRITAAIQEAIDHLCKEVVAGRAALDALEVEQVRGGVKDLNNDQAKRGIPPFVNLWGTELAMIIELRLNIKSDGILGRRRTYLTPSQLEENDANDRLGGMSLTIPMKRYEILTMRRVNAILGGGTEPPKEAA